MDRAASHRGLTSAAGLCCELGARLRKFLAGEQLVPVTIRSGKTFCGCDSPFFKCQQIVAVQIHRFERIGLTAHHFQAGGKAHPCCGHSG